MLLEPVRNRWVDIVWTRRAVRQAVEDRPRMRSELTHTHVRPPMRCVGQQSADQQ